MIREHKFSTDPITNNPKIPLDIGKPPLDKERVIKKNKKEDETPPEKSFEDMVNEKVKKDSSINFTGIKSTDDLIIKSEINKSSGIMGATLGRLFGTFLPFPQGSKFLGWLGDQEEEYVKNILPYKDPKTPEEQEENAKVIAQRIAGGVGTTITDTANILKSKITSSESNKIKRSNIMKINSNTFSLEKESYEELENVVKKIAEENGIEDVEEINIKISKEDGVVIFKQAKEKPKGESGDPMAAQTGGMGYSKGKKEKKNKSLGKTAGKDFGENYENLEEESGKPRDPSEPITEADIIMFENFPEGTLKDYFGEETYKKIQNFIKYKSQIDSIADKRKREFREKNKGLK
jgi:hypothetical protein